MFFYVFWAIVSAPWAFLSCSLNE